MSLARREKLFSVGGKARELRGREMRKQLAEIDSLPAARRPWLADPPGEVRDDAATWGFEIEQARETSKGSSHGGSGRPTLRQPKQDRRCSRS